MEAMLRGPVIKKDEVELEVLREEKSGITGITITCRCSEEESFCQSFAEGWSKGMSHITLEEEEIFFYIQEDSRTFPFRINRYESEKIRAILDNPVKTTKLNSIQGVYEFRIERR